MDQNIDTAKMQDIHVRNLNESDYFGEVSLIYDNVRTATVTTTNYSSLGKIKIETIWRLCANYPFFKKAIMQRMMTYDD